MSFGEKLTKFRKEKGMSQEDLANNLNVSRQAVSKWESNSSYPETEKIVAICKLFGCSMDELIGLKEGKIRNKNQIFRTINESFDKFIKGIRMFYRMTFTQKIKCIIEMGFYFIVLLLTYILFRNVLIIAIRNLLAVLPFELLNVIIQIFDGLFYLVGIAFAIYALIKLYKVRYLDYYENYLIEKENKEEIINEIKEEKTKKINIKEEKIIIRDANNTFKPFLWIKKSLLIFGKCISFLCVFCLSILFVLLIAFCIFTFYFIDFGLLIFYIVLCLLGAFLGLYIFIEIFVKYIFNLKQSPKRLFIMFIIAMIIVGISSGLFACELTTYKINNKREYTNLKHIDEINMNDNLVINLIKYKNNNTNIIYEDRNNILIEFYGTKYNITPVDTYFENYNCDNPYDNSKFKEKFKIYTYNNYDYFNGNTFNDYLRNFLQGIKNKEILNEEDLFELKINIYISKDNYNKIIFNNQRHDIEASLYNCYFE